MMVVKKEDLKFAKCFAVVIISISALMFLFDVSGWGFPLIALLLIGPTIGSKEGDELGRTETKSDGAISGTSSSDSGGCDGC